jgi:hypothetical protein
MRLQVFLRIEGAARNSIAVNEKGRIFNRSGIKTTLPVLP